MPWKFACDFRFHEVLQTTIIRQITKEKGSSSLVDIHLILFDIKSGKISKSLVWFGFISLFNGISAFVGNLMPNSSL